MELIFQGAKLFGLFSLVQLISIINVNCTVAWVRKAIAPNSVGLAKSKGDASALALGHHGHGPWRDKCCTLSLTMLISIC